MAVIVELGGVRPTIGEDVWLAPTAVLVGDVRVGDRASIWFGAVLRGDSSRITIGAGSSVQDNAVIHCAEDLPTVVGDGVIVGHAAMLEGCVMEDGAVVGMGAIVLQRARVGAGSMLAAGAVLSERRAVGPGMLAAGGWSETAAAEYQAYRRRYLTTSAVIEGS